MHAQRLTPLPRARDRDLALALEHHAAGRLDDAAREYQQLYAADGRDSEVVFLMGVLSCDLGLYDAGLKFLEQALAIAPDFPEARAQLAVALNGLAEAAIGEGQLTAARRHFERALLEVPGDAATLQGLGRVALLLGDSATAELRLLESLARRPRHVQTLNWLGLARLNQARWVTAEHALREALYLQPDLTQARNNLGLALYHQERFPEAVQCFEAALAQDPAYPKARINLGVTLRLMGDAAAARTELETVLDANPDEVEALNNLGVLFQDMGFAEPAFRHLSRALELAPDAPTIRWNLSLSQLLRGDVEHGWANYESRWEGCEHLKHAYRFPRERAWRGEPLEGKRLLLWAEQGFGDTIQFIRFAQDVASRGAVVSVMAPAEIAELVRTAPGVGTVHVQDGPPPPFDYHCPLLSLPLRLGVTLDPLRLRGATVYVRAPEPRVLQWRRRIGESPGLKVGLVWSGNARDQSRELRAIDVRRSVALTSFAPIVAVPGCRFFSLQKGAAAAQLSAPPPADGPPIDTAAIQDFSAEWADFSDTAAFVANLDLVISVDTAVAHLAGALGKPVWLLNRYDSCWRWLQERGDSPWYATLRQFRQRTAGDWQPVIAEIAAALAQAAGDAQAAVAGPRR
jgi:tetratricopeptide (TPR) repeat protein